MASTSGRAELEEANRDALSTVAARFTLHLHPSKTQDIMEGVREQLNMGLMRYSEDLGGVLLAYRDERVTGSVARLHPYFPFLAVTVTATATLFCPRPGQRLVGRVVKVGSDYVGLLLLGVFNAAIGADRIRREFKCAPESGSWVSLKDATHRITVGSYVRFAVDSVVDHTSLFSIVGSLLEPGTGHENHRTVRAAAEAEAAERAAKAKAAAQQQQRQQKQRQRDANGVGDGGAGEERKHKDKGKEREKEKGKEREGKKDKPKHKEKKRKSHGGEDSGKKKKKKSE
ncbi:elongation factor [Raphidocelis subcapitata]|uniref:Elongation factor n=1 Tax=Raphidocelis subcapitata TaxID=307507 RepID=A0A2V0PAU3_9CHLO|nr:elongation factor [Raphidocelis subcapitata]|eukprot:GBF96976.1 elongation factor [Raphidocelis subcapitata]